MNIKKLIAYGVLAAAIMTGCEDMMTRIDIDSADYPPQLAVTAILDTDGGRFSVCISAGYSISHYKDWRPEGEEVSGNGTINLYMDDDPDPVLSFSDRFRLSGKRQDFYFDGRDTVFYGTSDFTGFEASFVDIPAKAGSAYRLEVSVEGFPTVTSTAVMPDDPIVAAVSIDTATIVAKNRPAHVSNGGGGWWIDNLFWPISLTLTDNSPATDYYSFAIHTELYSDSDDDGYWRYQPYCLGTTNTVLIRDNPDVEASGLAMELSGESNDIYLFFDKMPISDAAFANTTATFPLYMNHAGSDAYYKKRPEYDPDIHGREIKSTNFFYFEVKHLSTETFMHYRSLVQQPSGGGIFSEPVFVKSNMENGWGCFSLCNTKRIKLTEYDYYTYPDWWDEGVYY